MQGEREPISSPGDTGPAPVMPIESHGIETPATPPTGDPTAQSNAQTPPTTRFVRVTEPDTITASQARAARRREARRDEQAIAAWLREISTRPR